MKPSQLSKVVNVADMRERARRRLPKIAFDFIDGGVESEHGMERNATAFRRYRLVPRYLLDVSKRSMATEIFGRTYAMPYGISPTGAAGLYRREADILIGRAAKAANVPFILSCSSTNSVARVAEAAQGNLWFQLYPTKDPRFAKGFVDNARSAAVDTLVITVDVPVTPRRERNIRNGFTRPLRRTLPIILDGLMHPSWLREYIGAGGGMPKLENWAAFAPADASADAVADIYASQTPTASQTWQDIEMYREAWKGKLVLKGIMAPADALHAFALGVDGIIVSNHGGRQLDPAPASLDMLPIIRAAVGPDRLVMIDGGIRRGTDILIARCLGADMVFGGRPTLYGVATAGLAGAARVLEILRVELDINLAQTGLADIDAAGADMLLREAGTELRPVVSGQSDDQATVPVGG
jgi:L-lactate dehydrogenase (cytochrome)/(S)-mandelate dehydrogenase